jgi:hypothetical protein
MPEIALLNPGHRKGKRKRKRSRKSNGRFIRSRSNPGRHSNPRKRRFRFRRNPTSLGASMRSRGGVQGFLDSAVMPATVAAVGGLALDAAMNYLPIPDSLTTPALLPFTEIGVAAALGFIAEKIAGPRTGAEIAMGALTISFYELASSYLAGAGGAAPAGAVSAVLPDGTMGYFSPAYQAGYYTKNRGVGYYTRR